jgi:hypothetical protein
MLKEKKPLLSRKKLDKALGESIDELSDATKKSSRKVFDALIEEGVQTISHIFDKYKIIAKQKVIRHGQEKDDRDSE